MRRRAKPRKGCGRSCRRFGYVIDAIDTFFHLRRIPCGSLASALLPRPTIPAPQQLPTRSGSGRMLVAAPTHISRSITRPRVRRWCATSAQVALSHCIPQRVFVVGKTGRQVHVPVICVRGFRPFPAPPEVFQIPPPTSRMSGGGSSACVGVPEDQLTDRREDDDRCKQRHRHTDGGIGVTATRTTSTNAPIGRRQPTKTFRTRRTPSGRKTTGPSMWSRGRRATTLRGAPPETPMACACDP